MYKRKTRYLYLLFGVREQLQLPIHSSGTAEVILLLPVPASSFSQPARSFTTQTNTIDPGEKHISACLLLHQLNSLSPPFIYRGVNRVISARVPGTTAWLGSPGAGRHMCGAPEGHGGRSKAWWAWAETSLGAGRVAGPCQRLLHFCGACRGSPRARQAWCQGSACMGLLTRLSHQHLGSVSEGKHGAKTSQIIGGLRVYFFLRQLL